VNLLETDMSTPRNNATTYFPSRLHWSSEQLADAVPLRLHQLFAFDASSTGVGDSAANALPTRRAPTRPFLPATPAPDVFRVR
jgi:hypothetical protein